MSHNKPPDWTDLAKGIAEQEKLDALVVTGTLWIINDIIVPAMAKGFPSNAKYDFGKRRWLLPNGTRVYLQSIASEAGIDMLRGMEFDLIFFDPTWQGSAEWIERIRTFNRRPYVPR